MKISIKSKNATSAINHNRATVALKSTVANAKAAKLVKGAKTAKTAHKAVVRDYKGITGKCVLLVEGGKGKAFRLADVDKNGVATLIQNNVGLNYKGAQIDLLDTEGKLRDGQQRLELGDYIAAKGCRASVKAVSIAQAQKLAAKKITVERNGKEVQLNAFGDVTQHYVASIERFKTGTQHFFQLETARIGRTNWLHYAALVKA